MPALWKQRQEDRELEARLGDIVKPYLKKKKKKKEHKTQPKTGCTNFLK